MSEENHWIWGAGVGWWGAKKVRRLILEKSFELTTETTYGWTVTNVKRKRVPGGASSYSKTTKSQSMCGHVGQPTNYSPMNEVYETERTVSIQSEGRQAKQYRQFCKLKHSTIAYIMPITDCDWWYKSVSLMKCNQWCLWGYFGRFLLLGRNIDNILSDVRNTWSWT